MDRNAFYMDRGDGTVFIIWERLLGSLQEENVSEPLIPGATGLLDWRRGFAWPGLFQALGFKGLPGQPRILETAPQP